MNRPGEQSGGLSEASVANILHALHWNRYHWRGPVGSSSRCYYKECFQRSQHWHQILRALRRFYTTSEALSPDLMWHLLISRSFLTHAWWSRGWEKYRSGIFSPRFLFLLLVLDRHGLFTLFLFLTVHKRFVFTSSLSRVEGIVLTY